MMQFKSNLLLIFYGSRCVDIVLSKLLIPFILYSVVCLSLSYCHTGLISASDCHYPYKSANLFTCQRFKTLYIVTAL